MASHKVEKKISNDAQTTTTATSPSPSNDDVIAKIKKQVEFYFSDSNMLKDKHMRSQASLNPEAISKLYIKI